MNLAKPPVNPYAPPQAALDTREGTDCWRDGKELVVPAGAELPHRCVKCDAPAVMDRPRTFTWHSPGWYVLLFVAVLVYIIVALIVRKKVRISLGLCEAHRQRRSTLNKTAVGILALAGATLFGAISYENSVLGWTTAALLAVGIVVAIVAATTLSAARISDTEARFRGCGKDFLDSLPTR